jgi:hypothetical protein
MQVNMLPFQNLTPVPPKQIPSNAVFKMPQKGENRQKTKDPKQEELEERLVLEKIRLTKIDTSQGSNNTVQQVNLIMGNIFLLQQALCTQKRNELVTNLEQNILEQNIIDEEEAKKIQRLKEGLKAQQTKLAKFDELYRTNYIADATEIYQITQNILSIQKALHSKKVDSKNPFEDGYTFL